MHMSALLGGGFSVVTTLKRSVPAIEALARRYGMAHHCRRVRAAEAPVLALEAPDSDAVERIRAEIAAAIAEDGAECMILGCAGMADLAQALTAEYGVPVIDGVGGRRQASSKACSALASPPVKLAATRLAAQVVSG